MIKPDFGIWFILIALLPWGLRIISRRIPYKRTSLDWLIAVFLVTTWIGYWAAYDKATAWNKAWLIMTAVLLYYALVAQPEKNWSRLTFLIFCGAICISGYFFLTHDFIAAPRKLELVNRIGSWLMGFRPRTGWAPIHPNYVAGLAAITAPFILYNVRNGGSIINRRTIPFYILVLIGLGIIFSALIMTTSRGAVMAIVSGLGIWLLWQVVRLNGIRNRVRIDALFPSSVLIYLSVVIAFIYFGPANSGNTLSGNYYYGNGGRLELLSRSFYLLWDFLFTGGGLGAFPGLYSHYLLNIPFFNVPNSHNLFLDVAIETGLFGGLSYALMYLASIWLVSKSLIKAKTIRAITINGILLFSLIVAVVHGMVDNYLFNGNGTILSLFLVALAMLATQGKHLGQPATLKLDFRIAGIGLLFITLLFVLFSKNILSAWYANLGSVMMSQVELEEFPNSGWTGSSIASSLEDAENALRSSLQFDSNNRTANQRLGMIAMVTQNFESASQYLETAYHVAPGHRGIVKSLGYCYVWLGEMEKAEQILLRIPEAREELDVYIWWWGTQGRTDLSDKASTMHFELESSAIQ